MVAIVQQANVVLLYLMIGNASPIPPKSVNLAMETSFLLEPKDMVQNITILNNVRRFLDKIETILRPEQDSQFFRAQESNETNIKPAKTKTLPTKQENELTNFLTELGGVVINYNDEDVKSLAKSLNDVVTRNYATNAKFHEMFKDTKLQMFIKNTVKEWSKTEPLVLKVEIAKYITSTEATPFVVFFRNLNRFFGNDKKKLRKLLKKFVKAKKSKQFLKPLEKTVKFLLDRYNKMDNQAKTKLHQSLDILTTYVVKNHNNRLAKAVEDLRRSLNLDNKTLDFSESVKQDFRNSDNSIENEANNVEPIIINKVLQVSVSGKKDLKDQVIPKPAKKIK